MNTESSKTGVIKSTIHDIKRSREIALVFCKHGFHGALTAIGLESWLAGSTVPSSNADQGSLAIRARRALEELGPTFIKLGQILSTRPDLLPPVFIQEFEKLQDRAPSVPVEDVIEQVENALGHPLGELYAEFVPEPIATASMAQVHRAKLFDGRDVVVKVQRPGIGPQIRSDLAILYYMAKLGEATVDEIGLYNPVGIVREFDRAINEELNFLHEAANNETARANSTGIADYIIPEIIPELTASTIITQTYIDGEKLSSIEVGSERALKLCTIAMEAAFQQIFTDGFFHGDPHPGNMLVTQSNQVAFLDWGLVGTLSVGQQDELVDLIVAIISNDVDGITRTVLRMGRPDGRVNLRHLRTDVQRIRDLHLTRSLDKLNLGAMMEDIMNVAHTHRIRVNPEYALLTKATATVEGVLRSVYPDLDIIGTLKPYAERLLKDRFGSERLLKAGVVTLMRMNHLLRDVPMQVDQMLMDVEAGELRIQVGHPALDHHVSAMTILGSRVFMGFLAGGLIVGGSILLTTIDWKPDGVPVLAITGAVFMVLAAITSFAALTWHFITGGMKKLRLTPWLRFFRRR